MFRKALLIFLLLIFTLITMGCGRSVSNIEDAIIGHWIHEDEEGTESHMYIGDEKITIVYKGTEEFFNYVIDQLNEEENLIIINRSRPSEPDNSARVIIKFSNNDRTEFNESMPDANELLEELGLSVNLDDVWRYEDSKEKP